MGFFDSFLGHTAANIIRDASRETKRHNDLCYQLSDYEAEFDEYLKRVGCASSYIADWGCVESGNISIAIRKMDALKKKVEQYIELGGNPKYIWDLEEIDNCIEKVKYLKSKGCLDRQQEFEYNDLDMVKWTLDEEDEQKKREEEERAFQREQEITEIVGSDINSLSGTEFERVCQRLIEKMGFETATTKASGDGGIDLIAYNHQPLLSGKYIIQCKRYSGSVGEPIIRDLYGVVMSERANKGILMTTGTFTKSAVGFADGKPIELIDGEKFSTLLMQNDVDLDSCNYNSPEYILREELERTGLSIDEYQFYFGDEEAASDLIICVNELKRNNNRKVREKIIAILYDRLDRVIINDGDLNFSGLAIQGAGCIEKYAIPLLSSGIKDKKQVRIYIQYIMGVCDIIRGRFSDAILRYDELISYEDLEDYVDVFGSKQCKINLLRAICTLLKILGANDLLNQYKENHQDVIDKVIRKNQEYISNSDDDEFINSMLSENDALKAEKFSESNIVLMPLVSEITGEMKSLEESVPYSCNNLTIMENGKFKIWIRHPFDSTKIVGTEFDIDALHLQHEKNRIKILL